MMFIRNPARAYNFKAYTETFNYMVWVALAIFFITIPPILFLIMRYGTITRLKILPVLTREHYTSLLH
jgi:hypothetical protein